MRAGREMQIRPLQDRLQERRRRAPAPPAALVDLEIARALVVPLIEVGDLRNADFNPGLAHRVEDRPGDARALDPPRRPAQRTGKETRGPWPRHSPPAPCRSVRPP